jgi:HD-GYP domain-containing protein (c-di-GMP phosphodiesterase class II)
MKMYKQDGMMSGFFRVQTVENSSIILKFHLFFFLFSLIPLAILTFLYVDLTIHEQISLSWDQLNIVLAIVVFAVLAGYFAMRYMLNSLIDVSMMSTRKLREVLGPEKVQNLLKGDEDEIALLTSTFREITSRLEENVCNLELAKKTLHSVMTRVGRGVSSLKDTDTFLDLIVETMTEALSGKKGAIFLIDPEKKSFKFKAVHGFSSNNLEKVVFSVETSLFADVVKAKTSLVITKRQSLGSSDPLNDILDYPVLCSPLLLREEVIGLIAVFGRKTGSSFQDEEISLLSSLALQTGVAIENASLNANADKTYFETLSALALAVEAKDSYSRGHLERVGDYCLKLAYHFGLSEAEIRDLRDASKIHDVGKIGVTDDVLVKPSALNDQEWVMMRRHPEIGESIIKAVSSLQSLRDLVRHHHEKLDGSGYPDGLKGDAISLSVRILTVADIYDALTSDRPYRKAMPSKEAFRLMSEMGEKIDQNIVKALAGLVG